MPPNLFIVGAMKAGTTSLHNYLNSQPDVYMSPMKEPSFFTRIQPFPEPQYAGPVISSEADYRRLFESATSQRIIGESSISYLWDNRTASLLANRIPNARIIIILRDPVDRAYSQLLSS
jgi:Sulfotransferase family